MIELPGIVVDLFRYGLPILGGVMCVVVGPICAHRGRAAAGALILIAGCCLLGSELYFVVFSVSLTSWKVEPGGIWEFETLKVLGAFFFFKVAPSLSAVLLAFSAVLLGALRKSSDQVTNPAQQKGEDGLPGGSSR